jgi:type I restriction enzyme, S subunit
MKNSGSKIILSKLADTIAGQSPESEYYSNCEGTPFLQGNRTFGHIYPKIDTFTKKITKLASKEDLLISVRAPVGDLNFAPCELCVGRGLAIIKSKNGDNNFIYYSLKNSINNLIRQGASTTYDSVTSDDLNNFELIVPKNKDSWKEVSNRLTILDKKISLNHKINEELERMAKTLYDYWFVQFDFPNEKGQPYKSSGGKMVYNKELKREIPEGWEVTKLSEKLEFEKGVEPGTKNYFEINESSNLIPFYKVGDMDNENSFWITKEIAGKSIAKEGDILVSFDGTVGRIVIGLKGSFSSGIRKIYQKEGYFPDSYLYFLFHSQEIQKMIKKGSNPGSNLVHASDSINILLAPYKKEIIEEYNKKIESLFSKIFKNIKENKELIRLRDFFLPLLMNGQVVIK